MGLKADTPDQFRLANYFGMTARSVKKTIHNRSQPLIKFPFYRSETVNSNTVNSKFHLIRSYF